MYPSIGTRVFICVFLGKASLPTQPTWVITRAFPPCSTASNPHGLQWPRTAPLPGILPSGPLGTGGEDSHSHSPTSSLAMNSEGPLIPFYYLINFINLTSLDCFSPICCFLFLFHPQLGGSSCLLHSQAQPWDIYPSLSQRFTAIKPRVGRTWRRAQGYLPVKL